MDRCTRTSSVPDPALSDPEPSRRWCNRTVSTSPLYSHLVHPPPPSRKVLEQRKKAEEEEERWREKQRQREKKLQRVVSKRAQANDPHMALSQTHQSKLREFR